MTMDIQQLRLLTKKTRNALSEEAVKKNSEIIANNLRNSPEYLQATHIAYYLPIRGEADPTLIAPSQQELASTHPTDKYFYLPVLKKNNETGLHFIQVTNNTRFETNKYGITEPVFHSNDLIQPDQLDLVVMPLVNFDLLGNRIGMGGGFYDRTFAFKQSSTSKKPLLMGYAYEFQRVDQLEPKPWDVKLDGVVTDKRLTYCYS